MVRRHTTPRDHHAVAVTELVRESGQLLHRLAHGRVARRHVHRNGNAHTASHCIAHKVHMEVVAHHLHTNKRCTTIETTQCNTSHSLRPRFHIHPWPTNVHKHAYIQTTARDPPCAHRSGDGNTPTPERPNATTNAPPHRCTAALPCCSHPMQTLAQPHQSGTAGPNPPSVAQGSLACTPHGWVSSC